MWLTSGVCPGSAAQLIQSWSVNHSNHIPITIYMEPKETTLFSGQGAASINQQLASAPRRPASCVHTP